MNNPFRYFNSSPEVIRLVVMMYACGTHCRCATLRICWPSAGSSASSHETYPILLVETGLARCSRQRSERSGLQASAAASPSGGGICG